MKLPIKNRPGLFRKVLTDKSIVFCLAALCQCLPYASSAPASTIFKHFDPVVTHNISAFGDISPEVVARFYRLFYSNSYRSQPFHLSPVVTYDKLKPVWRELKSSEQSFIHYMQQRDTGNQDILASGDMAHGLTICQLRSMPAELVSVMAAAGMPECGITVDEINHWQESYIKTGQIRSSDGRYFGLEKYSDLDPGWLIARAEYFALLLGLIKKHSFNPRHAVIDLSHKQQLSLNLVGDWGTGDYPENGEHHSSSRRVMDVISQHPADLNIHLGDVYYAGTSKPFLFGQGEEIQNFLNYWKSGQLGSLALNSNHEMISGGYGYFDQLLQDSRFTLQKDPTGSHSSIFVILFGNWAILGLDSAYNAKAIGLDQGLLVDDAQINLLKSYGQSDHRIFLLTHHNGMNFTGTQTTRLWDQVVTALGRQPDVWYWGHVHKGLVFSSLSAAGYQKPGPVVPGMVVFPWKWLPT